MDDHNHFNGVLRSLDASVVVQGRSICSLQLCHSSARYVIGKNSKYCVLSTNCRSILHLLDFVTVKCFKQLYRKDLVLKPVCLMDSGKDVELKVHILQAIHFTVHCLHQCGSVCANLHRRCLKKRTVPLMRSGFVWVLRICTAFLRHFW